MRLSLRRAIIVNFKIMEASELVPALRSVLNPAARVLLMGAPAEAKSGIKWGKTAPVLPRVGAIAGAAGFVVEAAPHYADIAHEAPEIVVFDGAAILSSTAPNHANSNGHAAPATAPPTGATAPDLNTVRELRAMPELAAVTFVAIISERITSDEWNQLQAAGADAFLSADASPLEVVSRLQSAAQLCRARAEIADLRAQITRGLRIDDVTGVMTRRYFFPQAHRECARARRYGHPLSCLMVEVDHYRMLCARFSDAMGENVLRGVATIIGQWTRDSDIIARFSESKFVVLLPETDIEGATWAREKLLSALQNHPWSRGEQTIPVSVSVGEAQLERIQPFRPGVEESSESDDMGETALSTREAMAGLLEDSDAALSIARKGARVPEVLVPQMIIENQTPLLENNE